MLNSANSYRIFKRKLNTFRKDPVGSCSSKIRSYYARSVRGVNTLFQQWAEYQLRERRYLDFLKHRPPDALPPDFADLWFLYETVRSRKPRIILEFGSGCSTVILAQALWDNQRESSTSGGYLYSIDAEPYWTEVTTKSMPTHLQEFCEIWYSPLLKVELNGTASFRYARIPDVVPELIYLDGPALIPERQVAVDVLDIEDRFPLGFCLVVDGRVQNTIFLRKHLKRRYVFRHRKLFSNSVFKLLD